ncbi:AIPR family protein [Vibrio mediterranei]|uniref:AIPR family protein n=1 Tax=Vibrio mediterranei TaxID=689 RepID=UPI001EFED90E|nr:AIPR family protein [Vibrio mediterranei]MCG9627237.1 AIPR family protein [Vibrio mediterranei]
MDNEVLYDEYFHLAQEIKIGSISEQDLENTQFFNIYAELAAENGDTPDLEYCPILYQGSSKYKIDGYAFDLLDGGGSESGDLYLAVCDYYQDDKPPVVNAKHITRALDFAERFINKALSNEHLSLLEEEDPEYQLCMLIQQYHSRIKRIRVVVLTNGHLKTRKNVFETREVGNYILHVNVIDLERYIKISSMGNEPVEIDFANDFGGGIRFLMSSSNVNKYSSYLFAIRGEILADIFAAYGNRLLEQNVRTYLQARTNVNKGILKTIAEEPEMFLAYNNGITATASSVEKSALNDEQIITKISNLQIVNGGQTTASLLHARDSLGKDLSDVYVQVKLSVIDESRLQEVVPKISEYANTQNKVSLADLASNSPAQVKIQRLSQEVIPPQKAGHLHIVKWFYERSRGQYKNLFAYKTRKDKDKLEREYPKKQLIVKTDLAKYELAFDGKPHIVSLGAQKCFLSYTNVLKNLAAKDGSELNEIWYKRAIAKALLFKDLDSKILQSSWYKKDRGYKAQIVAYTIAACADGFRRNAMQMNLDIIWERQEVPAPLSEWMQNQAYKVASILKSPPPHVRNISEFAKKLACWEEAIAGKVGIPSRGLLSDYGVDILDFSSLTSVGKKEDKRKNELDLDVRFANLVPRALEIRQRIESGRIASPKNMSAIRKLEIGNINLTKGEKNALKSALERLEINF